MTYPLSPDPGDYARNERSRVLFSILQEQQTMR